MTLVVGLVVEHDHLRAVGVHGTRVLWGVSGALESETPLAAALSGFLANLPLGPFVRPRLTVALGPAFAQTKRLAGLPPLGDERELGRTVGEHAARFFLKNGVPLVITSVRLDADGKAWGAALQKPTVDTIVTACRGSRVRLIGIVPAADVLRPSLDTGAVAGLGRDAASFATAYGAAVVSDALTWRTSATADPQVPRWRLVVATSAAAFAVVVAALAPGLAARVAEHRAITHLAAIAAPTRIARRTARDLGQVTGALGEVGAFDARRRSVSLLLGALARALPEGAVLLALHVDSAGGSIVALAPRAGALVMSLERLPGISVPEITGPVTREAAGIRAVERATVRFRWSAP
jgi:hypothetical protein